MMMVELSLMITGRFKPEWCRYFPFAGGKGILPMGLEFILSRMADARAR